MFYKNLKYTLMALTVVGVTGCNQRTITIHPQDRRTSPTPRVEPIVQRPVVREEILINKNPNLGSRVGVPVNNPSVGILGTETDEHDKNVDSEIDKKEMESEVVSNTIIPRMPFPAREYARLRKRGRSTVSGTIFLENSNSSEKVKGKKVKLYLNPITSYSEQWYQESYLNGYKLSKTDKRIYNYLKFTMSNSSGSYNFFGVPRGDYFLVGTMKCGAECGFPKEKTVRLVKRVSVGSGVTKANLMKNVP
jgi:hypothetical protein